MGTWLKRTASKKKYVLNHERESIEQILDGLFSSDQPDKMKETLVSRICEEGSLGLNTENTVKSVLQVSSRWVLTGTTSLQVISGFKLFNAWGSHNLDCFHQFFTLTLVSEMLTHGYGGMAANVPLLLREGFRVMSRISTRIDQEHARAVQANVTKFVYRNQDRVVIRNLGLLLSEFTDCIPSGQEEKTNFCLAVIHHLSVGVPPENQDEIPKFVKHTDEIGSFFGKILSHQSTALVHCCLEEIFKIISAGKTDEPAICLATIIKYMPADVVNTVMKDVAKRRQISDESLTAAVSQMVEWLKWPTAHNIDMWLLCFLNELAAAKKHALLVHITEANSEQMAENLAYTKQRHGTFKVLSYLLLGFQHSPGPFHKCLEKMPIIVHNLRDEGTSQSRAFLKELSELVHNLMYQHTGFPELYDPVLDLIKDIPQPSTEEIKTKLNQRRWSSQVNCVSVVDVVPSPLVTSMRHEKLEMGKTGLENLGNTCYMNSVLQALYMCDQFRQGVLEKTPAGKEDLLAKLQQVFAHISHSFRPTLAPNKFLEASRPPWFLPGHQQDCSEFLKYLLDQLHEDEKSSSSVSSTNNKILYSTSISTNGTIKINKDTLSKAERKKAMVMLTSVKMKDAGSGFSLSRTNSEDSDKGSEPAPSLVERTFRGKVQTTSRCLACRQKSTRVENFADIHLAFPNSSSPADYPHKNLAGGNGTTSLDSCMEGVPSEINLNEDLTKTSENCFSLNDLISFYLKPEKLTGDNKYHCDQCGKLQDGERSIQIIESPQYLILTLLRFSYDTKLQARTKIFQEVCYPRTLAIPTCDDLPAFDDTKPSFQKQCSRTCGKNCTDSNSNVVDSYSAKLENIAKLLASECKNSTEGPKSWHLYGLTGVIVHSGASSECGHYYCYARHSQAGQVDPELLDKVRGNLENLDLLPDKWYNFNDTRVSHATFDSFSNVTKRFSKDTAYVLIYRKLCLGDQSCSSTADLPLRQDLRDAVITDNEVFFKEQEIEARAREERLRRRSSSVNSASLNQFKNEDVDYDDNKQVDSSWCF